MADSLFQLHVVTPDELSEADRRIYELARAGAPLAELSVKLGLTLSEAERRLDSLVTRLGLPDRAALRGALPEAYLARSRLPGWLRWGRRLLPRDAS